MIIDLLPNKYFLISGSYYDVLSLDMPLYIEPRKYLESFINNYIIIYFNVFVILHYIINLYHTVTNTIL